MAKKKFEGLPFPDLVKIDTDTPVSVSQISEILKNHPKGVSICVRSLDGHPDRGGYFFHFRSLDRDQCQLYNFEKIPIEVLPIEQTILLINHCSGLEFSDWAFQFCQSVVNFRLDPD
ncbi:hypothetical protein [Lyngbya aestuarii]|uniref:hypothetical protein n=1 Tax=Lyngbya aestuarii TaxID=118322 RepID=UPI00058E1C76|nr:hypothetical protein [Lyngbya aestuarii]